MPDMQQRSVTELFSDGVDQFTKLIRNETAIARSELSAKAMEAGTGFALLLGGAVLLVPVFVMLLMALAAWFQEIGLRASLANLIAAFVGLLLSAGAAYLGKARLTSENLAPKHTMREFERDIQAVRERRNVDR